MKSLIFSLIAIYGAISAQCLNLRHTFNSSKYYPVTGHGAKMKATIDGKCAEDGYMPSLLERRWVRHALEWTAGGTSFCEHLTSRRTWIQENIQGHFKSGVSIFSRLCKKGQAPQLLEPLAGILRDPRMICDTNDYTDLRWHFSTDWLVLADQGTMKLLPRDSDGHSFARKMMNGASRLLLQERQNIFFDAGGTNFMDAMHFFTSQYAKRGIDLHKIYVWEAVPRGTEAYWNGTSPEVRRKWEPRLTFYDGINVTADPNAYHNPLKRILASCQPEDFCAFKLDIDTPSVEGAIVQELMESPAVVKVLDEFFFEHHVQGPMQSYGWGPDVDGAIADSYNIFTRLRKMGLRAHSWV